ncbi:MAG: ABC transporter ATP-binding protein [Chloroflexi bacterium]|nr:ABC transporter ATP-binding protein [Chloroflexota bacterium]
MSVSQTSYRSILVTYLRPQWRKVLLLTGLLLLNIVLQLVNPQIVGQFIDAARAGATSATLTQLALVFIGVALLGQVIYAAVSYMTVAVGWTATNALREDLMAHCLQLDMSFHTKHLPGEMIERIDGDVTLLANFFAHFIIRLLGSGLLLIGALILTTRENWGLGLLLTVFAIITLLVTKTLQRLGVPYLKRWRQTATEQIGFWEERLGGLEDIRSNGAIETVMQQHYRLNRSALWTMRRAFLMARIVFHTWEVLDATGRALLFAVAAYLLNQDMLTIGSVYLVFYYTGLISENLGWITYQLEDLQRAAAGIERIAELYHTPRTLMDGAQALPNSEPPAIAFQAVSFGYSQTQTVLNQISFQLAPGQVLGLLGRTGSGKTTLTRLLFRFYDPSAGTIYLDGVDLHLLQLRTLRQRIGFVTQDVQLFHATVRDNLTFFDTAIQDEQIMQAIDELGLQTWFATLAAGLETQLGPGGVGLSGGEAQLLAMTRILLRQPSLIILDEASARLDPATEHLLDTAIARLLHNRTAIIIAHRLATVARADLLLILDHGRVVEQGAYNQLANDPESHFYGLLQTGATAVLA